MNNIVREVSDMPKGSTKLRIAGIIETISTAFVMAVFFYGLFQIIEIGGYLKAIDHDGYINMILVLALYIAAHIYRFAVSIHVTRRADYADRAGGILGNGIAVMILNIIWLIIVIRAYQNGMEIYDRITTQAENAKLLITAILVLSIVDIVMYFLIIVGAVQNMPKNVTVNSWGADPYARYNMPPTGAPYGGQYQNPYNNGYQNNTYPQQGNYPPGYANPYASQQQGGYYQQPYQQGVPQQQYRQPYQQPAPQQYQPQPQAAPQPQQTYAEQPVTQSPAEDSETISE